MTAITDDELEKLTRLSEQATPWPWVHATEHGQGGDPAETSEWEVVTPEDHPSVILASEMDVADAEFVVAARRYLPLLIADLRRLRG